MSLLFSFLSTSFIMSAIGLLLFAIFAIFPHAVSMRARRIIWIVVLAGMVVLIRPVWGAGIIQFEETIAVPVDELVASDPGAFYELNNSETTALGSETMATTGETTATMAETTATTVEATGETTGETAAAVTQDGVNAISIQMIVIALWLAGAVGIFVRHMLRYAKFQRIVRRWAVDVKDPKIIALFHAIKSQLGLEHREVRLATCASITTPMLTGIRKPAILIPPQMMEPHALSLVLRHELIHLKHGDLWVKVLGMIAMSMHWFNPIVSIFVRAVDTDCEVYCDSAVMEGADLNRRRFYGDMIIGMVGNDMGMNAALTTCFKPHKHNLKRRLDIIMRTQKTMKRFSAAMIALVIALTLLSGSIVAIAQSTPKLIGIEKAKSIALADAKLAAKDVTFVKAKLDIDDGRYEYDIEFYKGNVEYDYEIDAVTGAIREADRDIENYSVPKTTSKSSSSSSSKSSTSSSKSTTKSTTSSSTSKTDIGSAKAKSIALAHAKLSEKNVSGMRVKTDWDDGRKVYDVEFRKGKTEYEYEIDAKTGKILEWDIDRD